VAKIPDLPYLTDLYKKLDNLYCVWLSIFGKYKLKTDEISYVIGVPSRSFCKIRFHHSGSVAALPANTKLGIDDAKEETQEIKYEVPCALGSMYEYGGFNLEKAKSKIEALLPFESLLTFTIGEID